MGTFAERYGFRAVRVAIQRNSMDQPLRNALWDAFGMAVIANVHNTNFYNRTPNDPIVSLMYQLWNGYFKEPIDSLERHWSGVESTLRKYFMACEWYEAYSFIEFVVQKSPPFGPELKQLAGAFMKREMAAYSFVKNTIVEITDEGEIRAIESAIQSAPKPVSTHLAAALTLLSDRKSPDYRNSVKESISAVEAAAQILTNDKSATLSKALKALPEPLHPAFELALIKLYGYTSDANGVRHALSDESTIDAPEARFMLIACSAFVNLLRERGQNALR